MSLITCILHDMVSRFTLRLSLYDSQFVLLGSLKVTLVIAMLPTSKRTHLWSSDTYHLLTYRSPILLAPNVKSTASFLLQTTKVGSLHWLEISRFELTRYFMKLSPLGWMPVLPHNMWCALALHPMNSSYFLLQHWSLMSLTSVP
jgi:hypothetical protein